MSERSLGRRAALTALCLALLAGCGSDPAPRPADQVEAALAAAGANRGELEKVLAHFDGKGDTLMLDAARYLIGNMEGHSYVTYALIDSLGDTIPWDAARFPDYGALQAAYGELEKARPGLDFKSAVAARDLETVTADYLIENVELAFAAWRTKPWARKLSYEEFREGVLPYRGSNEPLEPWRAELMARYADLAGKMTDSTDPVEAARLINDDIKSWFRFDERWYFHPTDQGLAEMKTTGRGRCEDMTNLTIYAMRANGLAVTSDYTPYWANAGNNHAWNALILPGGKAIPFMGAEADPGEYNLIRRAAKVYRKSFARQPRNLAFVKEENRKVPGWLAGKSYRDVTAAYGEVCDVAVTFAEAPADSVRFAYLCVFNDGEWKPIQWAEIAGRRAVFAAMAPEVVYLPGFYLNEEIVPAGEPFLLEPGGVQQALTAELAEPVDIVCRAIMSKDLDKASENASGSRLMAGVDYELFFWGGEWKSLGTATAAEEPLVFLAPSGGLYRLAAAGSDGDERIFTWREGAQTWW
ncbi:MAG TPA: transglutaminase-like domain-containing protein [candidate division Zixibacteria bacterium]|nr:transglutaminase domain-containing protein [candidate division Zixibacteria bacterium]MDD4916298.1 transglutaminase-like domain-containing protein [candidate division Zixibacteria bacterium]HOD65721.1 transglutaminase-like domain-containing protein [candidate division Zixibacteria bacterium]HOZ06993.1 transglutaminase-like domain-containing protein [candidate division Zixibacteria bacterium]HPM37603.1 transglutaminase-like domain-containing protein [candidate division Zixibacteria bacterium]